jgi:hypothetical protein
VRTVLANDAALTQCGQELGGTVEVRQFDVGGANTLRIVRVRANPWRQLELVRKMSGADIVVLIRDFGVEHFNNVELTPTDECLEDRKAKSGALGVKGVRRVDQTTLGSDAANHFGNGKDVRDPLREEQADQLARRGSDFFAHDDPHVQVSLERGLGHLDGVVVSDAHDVKSNGFDAFGELIQGGARITRCAGMQMTVKANKTRTRGWRRPDRTQQQRRRLAWASSTVA